MACSDESNHNKIIVDSVHGDIRLTDLERRVVDTAPFQRLRQIKQLGMGHLTYPNATHTRFAHSIGVFHIMCRVLEIAKSNGTKLKKKDINNLRLAALLHDIGHYPYSHLLEKIDTVDLTEEYVQATGATQALNLSIERYPKHEEIGRLIVTEQPEIKKILKSKQRGQEIADIFTRDKAADPQISKLIHSSSDMDRLDYLIRDSIATGVPYGRIDINYLLNNMRVSKCGMVGFSEKALAAVEHMLLARFYMHRAVYYHKTTFGFEQACAQLLRRLRDLGEFPEIPKDAAAVREIVTGKKFMQFQDSLIDRVILQASSHSNPVISALAQAITRRTPPVLLKEVSVFHDGTNRKGGGLLRTHCKNKLQALADEFSIPIGQFLLCQTPQKLLEARGPYLSASAGRKLGPADEEETTFIFQNFCEEPDPIVDLEHSFLKHFPLYFQSFRLYVVYNKDDRKDVCEKLRAKVANWDQE